MRVIAGIDIGGTKCAITFARQQGDAIEFLDKTAFPTETEDFALAMDEFCRRISQKLREHSEWELSAIGISCGGPLDAQRGWILSPPNLPRWEQADVVGPLRRCFRVPVMLQNDADACALAEWSMGAGKGSRNMVFLTFGTGMGAGLILNGELYSGSCFLAGEVGHIRLAEDGPLGYGKCGSFEGFCSGNGIAGFGRMLAKKAIREGKPPLFCPDLSCLDSVSCGSIAEAMEKGDKLAREIFDTVGDYLGRGLAILIDLLNPEVIVIGSIFLRQQKALEKRMYETLEREALAQSVKACRIVPAGLGEMIGDYAAISVGIRALQKEA